jgi:hypothetical protein
VKERGWGRRSTRRVRGLSFGEDVCTTRTSNEPANLAPLPAVTTETQDAGYLHIPEADAAIRSPSTPSTSQGLVYFEL